MKKFIIIDGAGLIYRAFFAIPSHFTDTDGHPTNAVYGFVSMLINILSRHKPDYIAVAFDRKEKTFRHERYEGYKATRVAAPDALYAQIPVVKETLAAFHIQQFEKAGFEADDIIATIAKKACGQTDVLIATGDFDIFQIISSHVMILYPEKGYREPVIFDEDAVVKKYAIRPKQIPDFKGLCGDVSDNIKGVAGIGEKTSRALLQKYGTIESIYSHLDEITGAAKRKLEAGENDAIFCKNLATLDDHVPIDFDLTTCAFKDFDMTMLVSLFQKLRFDSLLKRIQKLNIKHALFEKSPVEIQKSLF